MLIVTIASVILIVGEQERKLKLEMAFCLFVGSKELTVASNVT